MKITCNAAELAELLGISRSAAYNLMHRTDFPAFRVGKRLLVKRDKVFEWVDAQSAPEQLTIHAVANALVEQGRLYRRPFFSGRITRHSFCHGTFCVIMEP